VLATVARVRECGVSRIKFGRYFAEPGFAQISRVTVARSSDFG
jgi:hypothetical protein